MHLSFMILTVTLTMNLAMSF